MNEFDLINELAVLDKKLPKSQAGDWLYTHKESGQTFEQYKLIAPVTPNSIQKNIYLQPIGSFSEEQDSIIKYTSQYLEIFFNLKTIVLNPISDTLITPSNRRLLDDGHEQFLTTFILDSILQKNMPKNAIVMMAITAKDLYPQESWNFVFGQAYTKKRIGVSSMYRYHENKKDYKLCLERLIKVSSHEIGHMFSILHCTNAICAMNGTNHLAEMDSKPNRLCNVCLSKLYWNLEFDNVKRLIELKTFFENHKLINDRELIMKDLNLLDRKK